VVNYDLPQIPEDFIHRVGRTGRAGLHGTASTFSTRSERGEIRKIERLLDLQLTRRPVPSGLVQEAPRANHEAAVQRIDRAPTSRHGHHVDVRSKSFRRKRA
jgi:ATP-dependent RNA helicase RhlE